MTYTTPSILAFTPTFFPSFFMLALAAAAYFAHSHRLLIIDRDGRVSPLLAPSRPLSKLQLARTVVPIRRI